MKINPLYIIPNLFTAMSAFLGISSIIYASNGKIEFACWLVIVSMILDGLDGRVARITNTSSKFGVEFDSLCDMVAFGCAPSILLYLSIGNQYGRLGLVVSSLFVVFGAIRLARFNIIITNETSNYFIGLPIPSAAIFVVTMLILKDRYNIFLEYEFILLAFSFIVGILMVSNIRYPNFKHIKWNLSKMIILIILLSVIFIHPIESIFILITLYIIFGIIRYIYILISKVIFRK
ncbi:CDP-diacylglycerol--serine O-phosphatidyltransferase [Helicobacter sp. MIT 14-3879]|uniref:CDP-diacylglycerol--serine O-phosphatidyltransferase n=1 Tax=Helicobacter sp. MIT 14-3879 TaxID=2040649 RepID=UPI000E1F2CD5|nr:CDP-diacylglycerol--serine O-phosphatidyltransferase [Helicobacter sp. MIT 14-3879]RDU62865.1 CDP-diacylglycerol--serine O-phosphatidyltransferase [Helicobacter sp. MIT 14-3879]